MNQNENTLEDCIDTSMMLQNKQRKLNPFVKKDVFKEFEDKSGVYKVQSFSFFLDNRQNGLDNWLVPNLGLNVHLRVNALTRP